MHLDTTVYPDLDRPPTQLRTRRQRADYVQRICSAWDFGIVPDQETVNLFATWQGIFDRYPLETSLAYHAFRARFGWPPVAMAILETPWEHADRLAGRMTTDPCLNAV
jgi:hypothetical protein